MGWANLFSKTTIKNCNPFQCTSNVSICASFCICCGNPLTGNRTYSVYVQKDPLGVITLYSSAIWPGLLQCFLHEVVVVTFEWILALAGIKSTELFNCKIWSSFCHLWSFKELHWVWFSSPDLQHRSKLAILKINVRAKEKKFVWLVVAIDSIVWSNFGSQVPSESWNWKHGKMLTIILLLHLNEHSVINISWDNYS